jgi:CheY-like chemotaxis protein
MFGRLRVLVVEDEPYTRRVIRSLLRQSGVREIAEAVRERGKSDRVHTAFRWRRR